jgi:YD repeat-containing protein
VNASRQGEYFHHPQSVTNATAQYPTLETKSLYGATETKTGKVFVPTATENYQYDLDGNLTQDGRWTYTWDGENRLVKQESLASGPTGSKRRLEYAYDHQGRRLWRKVTNLESFRLRKSARRPSVGSWHTMARHVRKSPLPSPAVLDSDR